MHRLGRDDDAISVYQTALQLEPGSAERGFIHQRLHQLTRR
jgi:predicted RNA polymerase sigma factor